MMGYFFLSFSVCAPNSTTINLDLLSQRQNGILVGIGLAIVGVALAVSVKIFFANPRKALQSEMRIWGMTLGTVLCIWLIAALPSFLTLIMPHAPISEAKQVPAVEATKDILAVGSEVKISIGQNEMLPLFIDFSAVKEWLDARAAGDKKGEEEISSERLMWLVEMKNVDLLILEDDMRTVDDGKLVKVRIVRSEPRHWYVENKKGWMFASTIRESRVGDTDSHNTVTQGAAVVNSEVPSMQIQTPAVAAIPSTTASTATSTAPQTISSPIVSIKQQNTPPSDKRSKHLTVVNQHLQALKDASKREAAAQTEVASMKSKLADISDKLESAYAKNRTVEKNLEVTDRTLRNQRDAINDLTVSLGNKRLAEREVPIETRSTTASVPISDTEPFDDKWSNIGDFHPRLYKADVARRLMVVSTRHLTEPGSANVNVSMHFTIEADGRPTNIQILRISNDTEDCAKRCTNFILAAGPFRPLGSQKLAQLDVYAELVDELDASRTQIAAVQIAAMGNRF